MICVHVTSPLGVEAEFHTTSVTLAVELALRSERSGLCWRVEARHDGTTRKLSLRELRALTATSAFGDFERQVLDEIEWHHELATSATFN